MTAPRIILGLCLLLAEAVVEAEYRAKDDEEAA